MSPKLFFLNTLAVLAYAACLLQWLLVALPYLPGIMKSETFHTYVARDQASAATISISPALPSWIIFIIIAVIILVAIAVTVISLARLPRAIGTSGQHMTQAVAEHIVPIVTHHHKLPAKRQRLLTARIIFDLKLALLGVPIIIVLFIPATLTPLAKEALVIIIAIIGGWSLLLFCLQVIFARIFCISLTKLW